MEEEKNKFRIRVKERRKKWKRKEGISPSEE